MKYYKLISQDNTTQNETVWGENVTHEATGPGSNLCTADVLHVYDNPIKAVLMNPHHAAIANPKLWECTVRQVVADDGTKTGVKKCTTVREVPVPVLTTEQRVELAIRCALVVYKNKTFVTWAKKWLEGTDRTRDAAADTAARAANAANAAARAAVDAALAAAAAARAAVLASDDTDLASDDTDLAARAAAYAAAAAAADAAYATDDTARAAVLDAENKNLINDVIEECSRKWRLRRTE